MSKKYLYYFSEGNDAFGGDKVTMKNTLGGKGAGLAEMTAAGMPVPQGFTITTDACTQYYADGRQINDEITADIFEHLKGLEEITGKKFGDNQNPLLVSVRSGARQSMPGMMDTILNLGLNDEAVEGLAKKTGNARFAYDCYRRMEHHRPRHCRERAASAGFCGLPAHQPSAGKRQAGRAGAALSACPPGRGDLHRPVRAARGRDL